MGYTVGLDFGTHQTKVCIEDASNPALKVYEFFEFNKPDFNKTVLLPSIVQINEDDTLSYGFIDESQCKTISNVHLKKPVLVLPQKPVLNLPPKPIEIKKKPKPKKSNIKGGSIKDQLLYHKNFEKQFEEWEIECKKIDEHNKIIIEDWELECNAIKNDYDYDIEEYNNEVDSLKKGYEKNLLQWEDEKLPKKQIFRYFKIATFSNETWQHKIKPEIISAWYITFVLFNLQEKIGNDFYTQMGVPFSIIQTEAEKQKTIAYKILLTANMLIAEYKTLRNYLKTKYTDLLQNTQFFDYNGQDLIDYGLNVIPEAFAGLSSLTQQRRLERGMHLFVDIGGGTSDIAFFTITDNALPNIHAVFSIMLGLNNIFEEYAKNNPIEISKIQEIFRHNQSEFAVSISEYHSKLESRAKNLIDRVKKEFVNRHPIHNIETSALWSALENKSVVYCGGGSTYNCMRIPLCNFTDIRLITRDMLNVSYLSNKNIDNSLFTILATSYGLSIQMENEMEMTPIENVFDHLPRVEKDNNKKSSWLSDYEHGLSDL